MRKTKPPASAASRTVPPAHALPEGRRTAGGTVELNDAFRRALDLLENSARPVFITGRAGTGKSTLLEYFRETTGKRVVVLAPTGVAALNVRGQTVHSFCRFKPDITLDKVKKVRLRRGESSVYRNLETVVIDEISMVRADLLDCVETFLRLNGPRPGEPFGGLQMVFIGDLYQLPPVVTAAEKSLFAAPYETPYFFSARAMDGLARRMEYVELEKVYRQTEADFIGLLNGIRNRSISDEDLARLNARTDPNFVPPDDDFAVVLTATNDLAAARNAEKLARLPGRAHRYTGFVQGEFDRSSFPTDEVLDLKAGAQVMLLTNDPQGLWVNGSIGKIVDIVEDKAGDDLVAVELRDGNVVEVGPHLWELFRFQYEAEADRIVSQPVGSFTQYPLKLAWAMTIHKSQGKTFDRVVVDLGRGAFAHGQVYVALSRCTSFGGLVLRKPVDRRHLRMDWRVVKFLTRFQAAKAEDRLDSAEKRRLILEAIAEGRDLEILYLKPDDTKSRRRV
ncbi:MAG: AAA family ATPase, partial [Candidatus Aminicenantes bacterium]|nr:AAA family ATPase [Candidatus Aminicenantes bacterium]